MEIFNKTTGFVSSWLFSHPTQPAFSRQSYLPGMQAIQTLLQLSDFRRFTIIRLSATNTSCFQNGSHPSRPTCAFSSQNCFEFSFRCVTPERFAMVSSPCGSNIVYVLPFHSHSLHCCFCVLSTVVSIFCFIHHNNISLM